MTHYLVYQFTEALLLRDNTVELEYSLNERSLCNCIGRAEVNWGSKMVKECEICIVLSGKSVRSMSLNTKERT